MKNPTKLLSLATLASMAALAAPAAAENTEIRLATLAPSGSPWMEVLSKAQAEITMANSVIAIVRAEPSSRGDAVLE